MLDRIVNVPLLLHPMNYFIVPFVLLLALLIFKQMLALAQSSAPGGMASSVR